MGKVVGEMQVELNDARSQTGVFHGGSAGWAKGLISRLFCERFVY